jgi:hypothetical protein
VNLEEESVEQLQHLLVSAWTRVAELEQELERLRGWGDCPQERGGSRCPARGACEAGTIRCLREGPPPWISEAPSSDG